jgi:predicted glycogen debranching enzyme
MPSPRKPRAPKAAAAKAVRAALAFGSEICRDLAAAERREWLVTNGIGGFASGTVAGSATRRYHGLLVAALKPPAARTLLVGGLDEIVSVDGAAYCLATHRWAGGAVAPQGHLAIQTFRLEGLMPVWTYQAGSARIEKRIWMRHAENTTFVQYTLLDSSSSVSLELKALVNYRDFHAATHSGDWRMRVDRVDNGVCVTAFDGAVPFYLLCVRANCDPQHVWYRDCFFSRESERGLDDHEDQLFAADFHTLLEAGRSLTMVFSTGTLTLTVKWPERQKSSGKTELIQQRTCFHRLFRKLGWVSQLVLAADQFLVERSLPGQSGKNRHRRLSLV